MGSAPVVAGEPGNPAGMSPGMMNPYGMMPGMMPGMMGGMMMGGDTNLLNVVGSVEKPLGLFARQ